MFKSKFFGIILLAFTGGYGLSFQWVDGVAFQASLSSQKENPATTTSTSDQISASLTTVIVPAGTSGSTVINWSSTFPDPSIYVRVNGGPSSLFARARSGSQIASWIVPGRSYEFTLYPGFAPIFPIDSVVVTGVAQTGSVSASPTTVNVVPGQLGSSTLSWMTNGSNSQIFVSVNGAPETEFATGRTGSQIASWIQANHTYTFNLYAGTDHTHLLNTVIVRGITANVSGSLSVNPTTVVVAPGATTSTVLYWSLQNVSGGQIRYSVNQGSEIILRNVLGASGIVVFNQAREGRTYEFRLYPSASDTLLDTATLIGKSSYGFADQGLVLAKARTEYRNADIPNLTPLPNSCYDLDTAPINVINWDACDGITSQTTWPAANEWQQNSGFSSPNYWVIGMNTESDPWFSCNLGPPNMSEPNYGIDFKSGSINKNGRYGFAMRKDPGEGFWRAHLLVDNRPFAPQSVCGVNGPYSIPFLSVAAHHGFGNPTPVGVLNPTGDGPSATQFTAKMWDYDQNSFYTDFHIYAMSRWGGENRGVFVRFVREGSNNGEYDEYPAGVLWNWPIQESMYVGGANWVYFDADNVADFCPNIIQEIPRLLPCSGTTGMPDEECARGRDVTITIDWQALFECASLKGHFTAPLPANQSDIPIQAVGWDVEGAGTSGTPQGSSLWMSVHGMRMLPSPD